jgi:hypothetical protein
VETFSETASSRSDQSLQGPEDPVRTIAPACASKELVPTGTSTRASAHFCGSRVAAAERWAPQTAPRNRADIREGEGSGSLLGCTPRPAATVRYLPAAHRQRCLQAQRVARAH